MQATINLQGSPLLSGALTDFTYKWLLNAGLSLKESARFTLAVNEMATDIVRFAFPYKDGQFEITYNLEPSYIEVVLKEFGMPFDPDRHIFNHEEAIKSGNFDGAGLELIRKMSDKFVYLNHMKKGKELIEIEITGGIDRPPMKFNQRNEELWNVAYNIGKDIDLGLTNGISGGGSDGNFTSQFCATLDGLGAVGDGAHAIH